MLLSRPLRRFVACAAAAFFLACQSMTIAGADAPSHADATAPAAPCHDAAGDADKSTGSSCPAQCEFQNASSTPAKLVYVTTDLPVAAADFDRIAPDTLAAPPTELLLALIEPPPIPILYCRLHN